MELNSIRSILDQVPDAMLIVAHGGEILVANEQVDVMFGYPASQIEGQTVDRLIPERYRERHGNHIAGYFKGPQIRPMGVGFDLKGLKADGSEFDVEISLSPMSLRKQQVVAATIRDVTERLQRGRELEDAVEKLGQEIDERKKTEKLLRSREREIQVMADALPALISYVDKELHYRFNNQAFEEWFGLTPEELQGTHIRDLMGERFELFEEAIEDVLRGNVRLVEDELTHQSKGRRHVEGSLVPDSAQDGSVLGFHALLHDITDRVAAEEAATTHQEELAHVARLSTLGEFAAAMAHEITQPLSAILTNAQVASSCLEDETPDLDDVKEMLSEIVDDNKRASQVIRRLRSLLKKEDPKLVVIDLNSIVLEVVDFVCRNVAGREMEIVQSLAEVPPVVLADSIQLQQVLINLVSNAMDAIDEASGDRQIFLTTGHEDGSGYIIVRDTGVGIAGEKVDAIFAPFYSTKSSGLGIGLSISKSIMGSFGGRIWVEPGAIGTTFGISIPIHEGS